MGCGSPHEGLNQPTYASVAQWIEQPASTRCVAGSNPARGTDTSVCVAGKNVLDIVSPVMYIVCNASVISSVG